SHLRHHQHTQTHMDPDYTEFLSRSDRKRKFLKYVLYSSVGITFCDSIIRMLKSYFHSKREAWKIRRFFHVIGSILIAQSIIIVFCYLVGDTSLYIKIWLLPLASVNSLFS